MLTCFLSMLYCRSWQVLCTLWVLLKYHCRMCTLYTMPVVYPSWIPCPWGEEESVGARERLLCVLPRFCIWCVLLYLFSSIFIPKKKWTKIKNTLIGLVFFRDMQMEYVNCSSTFFLHIICGYTHEGGGGVSPLFVRKALDRVIRYQCRFYGNLLLSLAYPANYRRPINFVICLRRSFTKPQLHLKVAWNTCRY